jgi:hypothetical protein
MNDTHNNDNLHHPIPAPFWRENPELLAGQDRLSIFTTARWTIPALPCAPAIWG